MHAMAHTCGLSYDGFRKAFKRLFETAPQAFVQRQRFHLACDLLADGQSVSATAQAIGMNDVFHFLVDSRPGAGKAPAHIRIRSRLNNRRAICRPR